MLVMIFGLPSRGHYSYHPIVQVKIAELVHTCDVFRIELRRDSVTPLEKGMIVKAFPSLSFLVFID